ncbi:hypothetical protein HY449_01620 [Candidatus Pacearchaeota archaeon]|nr:hypothetical protein [Candidatus Pacearchaeota archaeon]
MDYDSLHAIISGMSGAIVGGLTLAYVVPLLRKTMDEKVRDARGIVTETDKIGLKRIAVYGISAEVMNDNLPHFFGYGEMNYSDEKLLIRSRKNKNIAEEFERQKAVIRAMIHKRMSSIPVKYEVLQ